MASSSGYNHLLNIPPKTKYHDVLLNIKSNYECIFFWEIHKQTEKEPNKPTSVLECVTQKEDIFFENKNTFDINRMCLRLIICYEVFLNGDVSKALIIINNLIQTLLCIKRDTFFDQISNACFHITHATQAYIMTFLDNDVEEVIPTDKYYNHIVLKNIKLFSSLNKVEQSAVYAIKSRIFLEYTPESNQMALMFAESARNFNYTELHWINIWLKAMGQKRRFNRMRSFPFRDEFVAAEKLSSQKDNPEFLLSAAKLYSEAGYVLRFSETKSKFIESNIYYKSSAKLILKAYTLASNNFHWLYCCLLMYLDLPKFLIKREKEMLKSIVSRLSQIENKTKIYEVLGLYYYKISNNYKDYKQAKTYMMMASSNGSLSNSLKLLKIECLLNSAKDFPVVKYLTSLYEKYDNPKRRLTIVLQIILYYIVVESNPKQLLFYLDIYFNLEIDFLQKKQHLETLNPLFNIKPIFNLLLYPDIFMLEIQRLNNYKHWSLDEKKTLHNIQFKFGATCNAKRSEENSELSCVVCLEIDRASIVLKPCLHQCVCVTCWLSLERDKSICPMCRQKVVSILKVPIL